MGYVSTHQVLLGAEKAFFEAMLDGYAGDKKNSVKTTTPDGYKTIEFVSGDYRAVDRYCVSLQLGSDFSAGTTTIFYKNTPVWWMAYGGQYPKEVIPFLKKALSENYSKSIFLGGRGPKSFYEDDYVYRNNLETGSIFVRFNGYEEIKNRSNGDIVGFHEYFGMSLV